jgi:hypothetical protein
VSGLLRRRPAVLFACGALVAGACAVLVLGLLGGGDASAGKALFRVDAPARESMSALQNGATPTASPEVVNGIPEGLAPVEEVHVLLSEVGEEGLTVAAWPSGQHAVCYKSSAGGAGCFDRFHEPFNWTISDPDQIGEGIPISVWGFVSDQVAAVSILVDGDEIPALVENNAVFVQLPDSATRPEGIEGFRVTSVDAEERVYPHGGRDAKSQSAPSKRMPAAANMSVFAEPQSAVDVALSTSPEVRGDVEATVGKAPGVAEHMLPGAAESGSLRALLTDVGAEGRSVWGLVTEKGKVCAGLTGFSSGCIAAFWGPMEHVSPTIGQPAAGEPVIVWGLAPDDVAKVEVLVDGALHEAVLGRNAFFYQLTSATLDVNAVGGLVVTLSDQSKPPIEIPFAPVPAPSID